MERKLTTILSADVVGYSRLVREDEAGTLAALKACRRELLDPKTRQYHGRTIKLMGDGALMEFTSVVEAVSFAVEVQCAMRERNAEVPEARRIEFRIGINVGDIIVEADDIYGDGVNIAARLEGLAEPGGICVRRNVYSQVHDKLDLTFEDLGEIDVKNIAQPIRAYRIVLDEKAKSLVTPVVAKPTGRALPRKAIAATLLALFVLAGFAWWQPWSMDVELASADRMAFPLPDKPSIAVLPFDNLSEDSEQSYFVDGMTEDLITDLSKISGLFVIARNSSFAYKGQHVKVRRVAEELGVRYILEGSVRRAGDKVRINAQLIDATTGGHVWAERYDGVLSDVFELQDAVTEKIVGALAVNLTGEEQRQNVSRYTDNIDAYDEFLRGWALLQQFSADAFVKAIPFFESAIELDPDYGRAHAALALIYWESVRQGDLWASKVVPTNFNYESFLGARQEAQTHLDRALQNPSPLAYRVASGLAWSYRQFDEAIRQAEKAVSLDPSDPDGHVALAWSLIFYGRHKDAVEAIETARRLDPKNPDAYLFPLGVAQVGLERFQEAIVNLERVRKLRPDYLNVNVYLAASYAHLGRIQDAEEALNRYTDVWITFASNVDGIMEWWPYRREVDLRLIGHGLVEAGLCCEELLEQYVERVRSGGTLY